MPSIVPPPVFRSNFRVEERAFGAIAPSRGDFAFTAAHLSEEQRALRRVQMHMHWPRGEEEDMREDESLQALTVLRQRMENGLLSPAGVECLAQIALQCAQLGSEHLKMKATGRASPLIGRDFSQEPSVQELATLAADAIAQDPEWSWGACGWSALVVGSRPGQKERDNVARDANLDIIQSSAPVWLEWVFSLDHCPLRDRLVERGVFAQAARGPKALEELLDVLLGPATINHKQFEDDVKLPRLRTVQRVMQAFGFDQGEPAPNSGMPALHRVLCATLGAQIQHDGDKANVQEWMGFLAHATQHPWLRHDHRSEQQRTLRKGDEGSDKEGSKESGKEDPERGSLIGEGAPAGAEPSPPHPLWVLAQGEGLGGWSPLSKLGPQLPEVIRAVVAMGYGPNGEMPLGWSGPGSHSAIPNGRILKEQNATTPSLQAPTALWAFLQQTEGTAYIVPVMRTLLALGANPRLLGGSNEQREPESLLASLNRQIRSKKADKDACEALFALFVQAGLDPVSALPRPSLMDAQPGLIRDMVRAALERQALAQELSMDDLQEAMALLRAKRKAETAETAAAAAAAGSAMEGSDVKTPDIPAPVALISGAPGGALPANTNGVPAQSDTPTARRHRRASRL